MPPQGPSDAVAYTADDVEAQLVRLRSACLALPQTSERPSHGGPAFFIRDKKCFVMFLDDHHDDGRLAIWCAAPDGVQVELVETDPERFFRPPYVGHRGWLGVHLLTVDDDELAAIVTEAFRTVAPPTVLRELDP
ncbi:MAG TPA: MmcQ/YjbR family DNA-binding protein [Microlunatus sp.]|nr:MmcQ/YjbR family DNA-binding protein [Microlunatus sp.]